MFKWLPCFTLLRRMSGNACCNHFFLQKKQWTHSTMCILLDGHWELCYSLSPTCGTTIIRVHQPCTKLLHSRVTVDYPDRSAVVMPNEPSNHKNPSFPAVSWTDEETIISLFSLSFFSTQPLLLPHLFPHFFKKTPTCFCHCSSLPKKERWAHQCYWFWPRPGLATPRLIL